MNKTLTIVITDDFCHGSNNDRLSDLIPMDSYGFENYAIAIGNKSVFHLNLFEDFSYNTLDFNLIIIPDNILNEPVLKLMKSVKNSDRNIGIIFHQGSNYLNNQKETLMEVFKNDNVLSFYDHHEPGSCYFDEFIEVIKKHKTDKYYDALNKLNRRIGLGNANEQYNTSIDDKY